MAVNETNQNISIKQYEPKNELNPDICKDDNTMDSQVRLKLLDIADDFVKTLEVKWAKPLKITMVGSMANYNWNKQSDIDIHISYDFGKIYKKKELVKDYFMSKRNEWNKLHKKLLIKGFNVEITVVDKEDTAVSNGMYDLEKNKWIKEPQDLNDPKWSESYIKSFCTRKMEKIDSICNKIDNEEDKVKVKKYEEELTKIGDDLIQLRKDALTTKQKELATGNIIVKVLRNSGYIDKLWKYVNIAYDKRNSLKETDYRKKIMKLLRRYYPGKSKEELQKMLTENFITRGYFDTYIHKSAEEPQSEAEKGKQRVLKVTPEQIDEIRRRLKK